MSDDAYTMNVKGLDELLKALKAKPPVARIGVLGDSGSRKTSAKGASKSTPSNAEIGAAHEYGAPARGLPQRSFLRVPLAERLDKELENSGALSKAETKKVLKTGSVLPWLKKVAIVAEGIVRGAFDSGGYGKWAVWKDSNYSNNANMLLVDSTQLRDSITSEVKE